MRFQLFWCEFRCAVAHTCWEYCVPEPSLTLAGSPGVVRLDCRAIGVTPQSSPPTKACLHVSMASLTSRSKSRKFCFPPFYEHPAPSICGGGLKYTVPRSTERIRPVLAAMRVMRPTLEAAPTCAHHSSLLLASTSARDWRTAAFWPEVLESLDHKPAQIRQTRTCVVGADVEPLYWSPQRIGNQSKAWRRYKPWPNR